jgi:hypothetical protein
MRVTFENYVANYGGVIHGFQWDFCCVAQAAKVFYYVVFNQVVHDCAASAMQHCNFFICGHLVAPFNKSNSVLVKHKQIAECFIFFSRHNLTNFP